MIEAVIVTDCCIINGSTLCINLVGYWGGGYWVVVRKYEGYDIT